MWLPAFYRAAYKPAVHVTCTKIFKNRWLVNTLLAKVSVPYLCVFLLEGVALKWCV